MKAVCSIRAAFAVNAPLVSPTLTSVGDRLAQQAAWEQTLKGGSVTAYVQGGRVTVQGPAGTQVPITVPKGTRVNLVRRQFAQPMPGSVRATPPFRREERSPS